MKFAALFDAVGKIEKEHEERYRKLLANIEGGLVFSRDGDMIWQCSNCGHIHVGKKRRSYALSASIRRLTSESLLRIIDDRMSIHAHNKHTDVFL